MKKNLPRCTFAIISHPDAGKTTMTENLLWFGEVVREKGMVKGKSGAGAKSDWMEMEKSRGISITSSIMSFDYGGRAMRLLDTPGHEDFSEDTYRTLTAVESALMMIDSAKGVEAQTVKLLEVCRLRDTPIVTFMNKFDRESLDPLELMENVEKICSIQCCPMTWPIGDGVDFKGVYLLQSRQILLYHKDHDPFHPKLMAAEDLTRAEIKAALGENLTEKLIEDLEMISELMPQFVKDEFLAGIQTPVFFGTALHNFGVRQMLETLCLDAPGPRPKVARKPPFLNDSQTRSVRPEEKNFTGFVFKIQANMDKNHRDRLSFVRVCSGEMKRGEKIYHVRSGKEIKISAPVSFLSRDRQLLEAAQAGDIIGLPGQFQIGDTFTRGEKLVFTGIPRFAPELFRVVELKDPMRAKHLERGLKQLSEEGAVQLFTRPSGNQKILGAVGALQFDVVKFRLEDEYSVQASYLPLPFSGITWPVFPDESTRQRFVEDYPSNTLYDRFEKICYAFADSWEQKIVQDKFPETQFLNISE